jgi:hypothetical protein
MADIQKITFEDGTQVTLEQNASSGKIDMTTVKGEQNITSQATQAEGEAMSALWAVAVEQ